MDARLIGSECELCAHQLVERGPKGNFRKPTEMTTMMIRDVRAALSRRNRARTDKRTQSIVWQFRCIRISSDWRTCCIENVALRRLPIYSDDGWDGPRVAHRRGVGQRIWNAQSRRSYTSPSRGLGGDSWFHLKCRQWVFESRCLIGFVSNLCEQRAKA